MATRKKTSTKKAKKRTTKKHATKSTKRGTKRTKRSARAVRSSGTFSNMRLDGPETHTERQAPARRRSKPKLEPIGRRRTEEQPVAEPRSFFTGCGG